MEEVQATPDLLDLPADPQVDEASQPFVGRWNQLVSTTNWEKGRIISQWRDALIAAGSPAGHHSDEAWARRVGGVTGQHVGRLRRVYQRFSAAASSYEGLFWTHFQAALDWSDAEMWLEGAVQSGWSVSQMRRTRWEAMGAAVDMEPDESEIVASETDEDFEPALQDEPAHAVSSEIDSVAGPRHDGPDFGDEPPPPKGDPGVAIYTEDDQATVDFVRPFENLAELPDDFADAFESYKLAILSHKADGWKEISLEDALASLDALKALAVAPSGETASF